jgi:serine phosphatase RsbU (regulator of sigma subunit)
VRMLSKTSSSITLKLFYLITGLILVTVIGMSVQSSQKFRTHLSQNIHDGSLAQAERAASDVSTALDVLTSKISVTLPKLKLDDLSGGSSPEIGLLLKNDPEILSASVFYVNNSSIKQIIGEESPYPANGTTDNRYEGTNPDLVKTKSIVASMKVAQKMPLDSTSRSTQVRNISPETGFPIMAVAVRFDISGNERQKVIVVLAVWQTRILVTLPKSKTTNTMIIDSRGDTFASLTTMDMLRRTNFSKSTLASSALSRTAPSGFQDGYKDPRGRERLGAFAQISNYPDLFVLLERDAEAAFLIITRSYYSAFLWAALFTLIAVLASLLGAKSATQSIRDLLNITREFAAGNFNARVHPRTNDEIAELGMSVNHMAGKITELLSTQVEKARYEKELETARMVQSTFFPKKDITHEHLKVTGYYQPATECGGDLWGHYDVSSTKQLVFIADAMGHGAPAALVTAIGYATCQAVATILKDEPNINSSPSKLLERLNTIICEAVDCKISMTFFAILIDFETGVATFANAGHNFPVIMTNNDSDPRLGKQSKSKKSSTYTLSLQLRGTPLGVERDSTYTEKTIVMMPGDRIFLFTDGLIENHYPNNAPIGRKALLDYLSAEGSGSYLTIKEKVLNAATNHFGSTNLADDVTIVVAEISKDWQPMQSPTLSGDEVPVAV